MTTERLAVTEEGRESQRGMLLTLRAKLERLGFTVSTNGTAGLDNDCKWYAWRQLPADTRSCECNEKPPSLIVTPHLYTIRDRQYTSSEVSITGQRGEWFQLKAYSVNPEELPNALPGLEAALLRAWNALAS